MLGLHTGNRHHANMLRVAYVPDSFGQNEQMPQIYKQFGLNHLIY
jgi:alpha-mannosidase